MTALNGKTLYDEAFSFLEKKLSQNDVDGPRIVIEKHLAPQKPKDEVTFNAIMERMLDSWKNAQSKAKVIGELKVLRAALFELDKDQILKFYSESCQKSVDNFLDHIEKHTGKKISYRGPRSHWPQFVKGVVSISKFLSVFDTPQEFVDWVEKFYIEKETRGALPFVLASEIHGFGYALACDFLKEFGYVKFAKPDVHLHDIIKGCDLCYSDAKDYVVHNKIIELAENAEKTPYAFDKVIWLIGSGKFYLEKNERGEELTIGNNKNEFITLMNSKFSN